MDNQNRFETQLFQFLKRKGFDFPTTDKGVEEFERKYGNTDLPVPEELKPPGAATFYINENQSISDLPSSVYKMAAIKSSGDRTKVGPKRERKNKPSH